MRKILCLIVALGFLTSLPGCRYIDFGGDSEKDFEFRFGWDKGIEIGEEDPENPGFDREGNVIPSDEVLATYTFPDTTMGLHVTIKPEPRITPTVGIELFEAKLGFTRWWSGQLFAGDNLAGFYFGKRLTSIYEITIGPFFAWDFDERDYAWGIGGTLIKF